MIATKYMNRLLVATVCFAIFALTAVAADPSWPLSEDEVTLQKIKTFFDAPFFKTEFDQYGVLKIVDRDTKTFIKVNKERKLITIFTAWRLKASVPETKKLQFVNTMNNGLIFVRFSMSGPTTLWCDYQFLYEGGITPGAIVNNYRLFAKVTREAVVKKDPEGIIGDDIAHTNLHDACFAGDLASVKALVASGTTNVNAEDKEGCTPLYRALSVQKKDVALYLLTNGANVNPSAERKPVPLVAACAQGDLDVVKVMIDKGADPKMVERNGLTPLHSACLENHKEIAELLIDKGADVNARMTTTGWTPLHAAKSMGNKEIADLLLRHGATE